MSGNGQPASWIDEEIACEAAFARSGAPHDWPKDEPETVTRMAASMASECARLRAEVERLRITDAEREAVREYADIAQSQLRSAEEGGDRETIWRWTRRVFTITGLLARAEKEDSR
jgi:hypothetical protein